MRTENAAALRNPPRSTRILLYVFIWEGGGYYGDFISIMLYVHSQKAGNKHASLANELRWLGF